jgi:XapX domain-containing protein
MKTYLVSFAGGLVFGGVYGFFDARSPQPPVIALIGLLAILLGEQIMPTARRVLIGTRRAYAQHVPAALPVAAAPALSGAARKAAPLKERA